MSAPTRPCSSQTPCVGRRIFVSSFSDGGLAGAVRADDAQGLAVPRLERDVTKRPELLLGKSPVARLRRPA